jgi:hypothetical protein
MKYGHHIENMSYIAEGKWVFIVSSGNKEYNNSNKS